MKVYFTRHAAFKIRISNRYGFRISKESITEILRNPLRIEQKSDGTYIASSLLTERHVIRIVYKIEHDIIIVITCYPGRRKAYGI